MKAHHYVRIAKWCAALARFFDRLELLMIANAERRGWKSEDPAEQINLAVRRQKEHVEVLLQKARQVREQRTLRKSQNHVINSTRHTRRTRN